MVNKKQKVFARVLCSILSVLIILGSFSLSAFAANVNNKYTIKQSPTHYKYIKYWGDDGSVASPSQRGWETFYKRTVTATGEAAYCLEFGKDFANGTSTDAVDLVDTAAWQNASNTAKRGVVLASIYGYPNSYSEYGDAGYYATQVIIWEYMLGYRTSASSDIYAGITGGYDENNKCCRFILSMQTKGYSDILEAYRGILTEMSKHTVKPNLGDSLNLKLDYDAATGKYTKTFTDTNGILSEFNITSTDGLSVYKNGNVITITSDAPINRKSLKHIEMMKNLTDCHGGVALYATANPELQTLICGSIPDPQVVMFNVYTDTSALKITKHSDDSNVNNVEFNVRCDATGFSQNVKTNASGVAEVNNLPVGYEYTITEITQNNYIPVAPQKVTLSFNTIPNVHFYNVTKKGSVTVNKADAETGRKLSGAEFVICKGTSWDWDNLVWNDTLNDDYFVTDENGTFTANNLTAGDYILREGQAPDGYMLDEELYPFTIADQNSNITLDLVNKPKEIPFDVDVEINKENEVGNKLKGAEFSVYKATSSFEISDETPVFTGISKDDGTLKIENLVPGYFVIKETKAPDRCALPANEIVACLTVQLNKEGTAYEAKFGQLSDCSSANGNVLTVVDNRIGVTLRKVDADTNEALRSVEFEVKSSDDDKFTTITDKNGIAVVKGLKANTTYTYQETKAPNGYYLDDTVYSFTTDTYGNIDVSNNVNESTGYPEIVVKNSETVFTIKKVDENDNPLSNAMFDLYNKENICVKRGLVTDENGLIVLKGYSEGDYYLVETKAPDGYLTTAQSKDKMSFSISAKAAKTITIHDNSTVVSLKKVNANENIEDRIALSGAEFKLYKVTDTGLEAVKDAATGQDKIYTTDKDGNITVKNLLVNVTYCFVEVKAPDGYYTNPEKHYFTITESGKAVDENNKVIANNEIIAVNARTSFTVRKVDSLTNQGIGNALFVVYKANADGSFNPNGKVATGKTDASGLWKIEGLPEGTYYAVEKTAPTGYVPNLTPIKFTIGFANDNEMTVNNDRISVTLKKVNADNAEITPSGAEFDLYEKGTFSDTKINKTSLKPDENGEITISDGLELNKEYYFVETLTPKGYYTDSTKHYFKINNDGKCTDKDGNLLNEVVISNVPTRYTLAKVDADTNEKISDVTFAIYADDGTYKGSYTTDENGTIVLYNTLPEGKYYAVETAFPDGYIQDSSHYDFEINSSTKDTVLTIKNKKTSVTLSKVDLVNGKPVEGATIEIYDSTGKCVYAGVSNSEGTITVDYLPVGTYTFKETINPDGYQINSETYEFTLNADGTITNGYAITDAPTEVIITKTDADGKLLKGATIGIYDSEGKEVYRGVTNELGQIKVQYLKSGKYTYKEIAAPDGYKLNKETYSFVINRDGSVEGENVMINESTSVTITKTDKDGVPLKDALIAIYNSNGDEVYRGTTNEFGKISVSGLYAGDYTYKELEAPNGYILDKTSYKFSIDNEGNVTGDNVIVNVETSVVITKTDTDGNPIEGATIGIYNENDELLYTLVTDKDGKVYAYNLLRGKYYFKEILPAEGYEINPEKHEFEIAQDGLVKGETTLENTLSKVVITKTDTKGNPLSGAEIGIYNSNNELVKSGTTDENGELVIYGLKPGTYYAQELKAPEGYVLSDKRVTFTVTDYGIAEGEFVITNEAVPVTVNLPQTGSTLTVRVSVLAFASLMISGAAIYVIVKKRQKKLVAFEK